MNITFLVLLTAIAPLIWGSTYFLTTEFLPENQPFLAAAIRCFPAGLVLLFFFREKIDFVMLKKLIALSFLNISLFQSMLFVSAYRLPGGIAALIGSLQPAIVTLLAFALRNEKLSIGKILLLVSAFLGMNLIFLNGESKWDTIGIISAIIGAISMSLGTFLSREWSTKLNLYAFTGYQLFFGGIVLLCISPFFDTYPTSLEPKNILGYGYLIVFGAIISYSLWFNGVKNLPIGVSSSLGFLSPISAILIGWVGLNQSLGIVQIIGVIVVILSLYKIISTGRKSAEPDKEESLSDEALN